MKIIGILLIVVGAIGIMMGLMMFGDIGIACLVGAFVGIISGIGFLLAVKRITEVEDSQRKVIEVLRKKSPKQN